MISLIVATAQNGAIGKDNQLLWHISDDLKRFKALTSGHTIVMGKNTYDSLPFKPLPKRENIVITRNKDLQLQGCKMAHSIEEILISTCANSSEEVFVIGGESIYKQFLPYAHRIYLTLVHKAFEGDAFFPKIENETWNISEQSEIFHDEASALNYQFITYDRKG